MNVDSGESYDAFRRITIKNFCSVFKGFEVQEMKYYYEKKISGGANQLM